MFDDIFTSIKNHTNSLSNTIKSKTRKISLNLNSIKNQLISKRKTYTVVHRDDNDYMGDYMSPRAYAMTTFSYNSVNPVNMEWLPYVPPSLDDHNVLDRFLKVITIDDEDSDYINANRRLDREEIRRRVAMSSDYDYYTDRPGRKPSLHARLQSGMNLQICFMNETVSDTESPSSDSECPLTNPKQPKNSTKKSTSNSSLNNDKLSSSPPTRPASLSIGQPLLQPVTEPMTETDFFSRQARLQTEARMALAQAKQMARMQMEVEKQKQEVSPITEMVRNSLHKIGVPFPEDKRRLSRMMLTDMHSQQLKVIVNDLHNQIEILNESLVKLLMERDDLHMEQDSMLVDIEDLTRYLSAKEQAYREQKQLAPPHSQQNQQQQNNNPPPSPAPSSPLAALNSTVKPHLHRIASLVKK